MTGSYAGDTTVPTSRSLDEIKRILRRFGATDFGYAEQNENVAIQFSFQGLSILMRMTLPGVEKFARSPTGRARTQTVMFAEHEIAIRSKWRTLTLCIKAKLAMVEEGLSTVEEGFLSDIRTESGETVGDIIVPQIRAIAETGVIPTLMNGWKPGVIALGSGGS